MSPLLIALLGVLLIPLFVATWRTSLFGLACQGFLMAFITYRMDPIPHTAAGWLTLVDLGVVRGLVAPLALYTVLSARRAPPRNDVIPPNLLSWTVAFGMVFVSFSFAETLVHEPGEQRTLVAVAVSGLLLGFLVLATQSGPFGQMIGALRIENAIAVLEFGGARHDKHAVPLGAQIGLLAMFLMTVFFFRYYLGVFGPLDRASHAAPADKEGPTL